MTPRQLWFHLAVLAAAGGMLLAAGGAALFAPLDAAARPLGMLIIAWQAAMALLLASAAIFNLRWGFMTARPMWVLIVAATLTVWLIPLAAWALWLWREERLHLRARRGRGHRENAPGKKADSASKDCSPP